MPFMARRRGRVGRNEPCTCGSGKKFKRCHGQEARAGRAGAAQAPTEAQGKRDVLVRLTLLRWATDIRARMDALGLTRDDLCESVGLSRGRVDAVLDVGPATMGDVVDVADAVGYSLWEHLPGAPR